MFSSGRDTQSSAPVVSRSPSDKREGGGGGGGISDYPPPSHPATLKRIPFDVAAALL